MILDWRECSISKALAKEAEGPEVRNLEPGQKAECGGVHDHICGESEAGRTLRPGQPKQ